MVPELVKGFIVLFFIFVPLERAFSLHKQKIFRTGWRTDVAYFFMGHFFGGTGTAISVFVTFSLLHQLINPTLQNRIADQPVWLQFVEAVVIADIGYYLAHKLLHTVPWLWKFHAVHHSIEQMDWLATVRVHPFDQIFTKTCQMIPLYFFGFTPESLGVYVIFSAAIAFFIHANFRVKFGVLRWVIATPEFHHWHHTQVPRVHNKNFAAQLPLLDWLFGTLYLPTRKMPQRYGVSELVPAGYLEQMLYPFRGDLKMENEAFKKGISRYLRPLPVILCLTFLGVSAVSIGAVVNHMDVPTFIASFNTQKVTVAELQQGKLKPVILIDVRSPEEYAEDHIGQSLLVPLTDIQAEFGVKEIRAIAQAGAKPNQPQPTIVLYCTSGMRSVKAYQRLEKTGLKFVVLKGGIKAWRKAVSAQKDAQILSLIDMMSLTHSPGRE
jgi:sterol desaturase/sphingolipid hydroxylase (fatty acid hydroxylase superfamily)/rhodanese-related sulfurtransferase